MESSWLSALKEVDPGTAGQLAPHVAIVPLVVEAVADQDAASLAQAWLRSQVPCPNVIIIGGISQMHLIEPLLLLKDGISLILLDKDVCRLAAGLNGIDSETIRTAIRSRHLIVDTGENQGASIDRFLEAVDFSRVPRIRLLDAIPIAEPDYQMIEEMTKVSRDLIRLQACDLATRLRFGKAWQSQTVRNIPAIVQHAGVKTLFGLFKGKPALVVAAGPSLVEALPYIASNRHRLLVICVGRVLAYLVNQAGIVPDLVVTGDGQEIVLNHFKHKPPLVPVVASCFSDPELVEGLDRLFFMELESMRLPNWLRGKFGELGEIYAGGNVATAALAVAEALGCTPIMTAGLDLSYPESGKTHVTGRTLKELAADPEHTAPKIYKVSGNYQPEVETNRQMLHYIDFTRQFVQAHPETKFVNLNTAGARIEGMQLARPEAMATYLGAPLNAACRIANCYAAAVGEADKVGKCRVALEAEIPQLQSLCKECMDAAMLCNQLIMLVRRPGNVADPEQTLRDYLEQLKPLDQRIRVDPVVDLIEARIEEASHRLSERMMTTEERAMNPAVRSHLRWRNFYTAIADACQTTEKLLKGVINTFDSVSHITAKQGN